MDGSSTQKVEYSRYLKSYLAGIMPYGLRFPWELFKGTITNIKTIVLEWSIDCLLFFADYLFSFATAATKKITESVAETAQTIKKSVEEGKIDDIIDKVHLNIFQNSLAANYPFLWTLLTQVGYPILIKILIVLRFLGVFSPLV